MRIESFRYLCSLTNIIRFGYVTNTKIKFIIVVDSANSMLRDNEVRTVSETLFTFNFGFKYGICFHNVACRVKKDLTFRNSKTTG